ncbi:hypothetical protein GCM10020220_003210 [Nonomuraea rubra]
MSRGASAGGRQARSTVIASGVTRTVTASGASAGSPTATAHMGSDPMTCTPSPSRCTAPAAGPPTTRTSATPPGSSTTVARARWESRVTLSPSRSTAVTGASGSSGRPSRHSVGGPMSERSGLRGGGTRGPSGPDTLGTPVADMP